MGLSPGGGQGEQGQGRGVTLATPEPGSSPASKTHQFTIRRRDPPGQQCCPPVLAVTTGSRRPRQEQWLVGLCQILNCPPVATSGLPRPGLQVCWPAPARGSEHKARERTRVAWARDLSSMLSVPPPLAGVLTRGPGRPSLDPKVSPGTWAGPPPPSDEGRQGPRLPLLACGSEQTGGSPSNLTSCVWKMGMTAAGLPGELLWGGGSRGVGVCRWMCAEVVTR